MQLLVSLEECEIFHCLIESNVLIRIIALFQYYDLLKVMLHRIMFVLCDYVKEPKEGIPWFLDHERKSLNV